LQSLFIERRENVKIKNKSKQYKNCITKHDILKHKAQNSIKVKVTNPYCDWKQHEKFSNF